jgi:hypothetical protein
LKISDLFEIKDEYKSVPALKKMGVHSNPGDEAFGTPLPKKKGMDADARSRRVFTRGFRFGFAGDRGLFDGGQGLGDGDMKGYDAAVKLGKAARKAYKGDVPKSYNLNSYGENKNNKEFEKILKPILATHLENSDKKDKE